MQVGRLATCPTPRLWYSMAVLQTFRLNLKPLKRLVRDLRLEPVSPHLGRQWAQTYFGFAQRRFVKYSRGGGDWEPLKPATLARRRKGKGKTKTTILWDKEGSVLKALKLGAKGSLFKSISRGVRVGFGGPARHPDGKATIADIARFHHKGNRKRNLPKRPIIVDPDTATVRDMTMALMLDMEKRAQRIGGPARARP